MASEPLLVTSRFSVIEIERRTPDGQVRNRAVVRHPGAVTIIPMVDEDHVCLIQNFRVSVNQTLIELPAGTLEPPEPPEQAAHRELIEETGYKAGVMRELHGFYLSPGILDERMHLYVATDLVAVGASREPGEEIENLVVSWQEAMQLVESRKIQDAKTISGLLLYDRVKSRLA
ncbi:MAG: NUDIX hydrolase [Planctomycetaceae bacterium]|nr:NUDIX hydrolase [Planctomycetales bacterium]MCB9937449.1 NUDIX hydrolase [Planctomycetaceae bacterium]